MKTTTLTLLTLLILLFSSHKASGQMACSDPITYIYGVDAGGAILPINVTNASVGAAMTSPGYSGYPGSASNANGLALRIQTGIFYYFHRDNDGDQEFVSFDPVTHVYKTLSPLPTVRRVVKACITADGSGYYCIDGENHLCYYDISTNHWTIIGSNLMDDHGSDLSSVFLDLGSGDMAIDARGRLWIIVSNATKYGIYCLPAPLPTTAQATVVMTEIIAPIRATPTGDVFAGIAFDPSGQIHMSTENDLFLLQGNLTLVRVAALSNPGSGADLTSCNFPFQILANGHLNLTAQGGEDHAIHLQWSVTRLGDVDRTELYRSKDGEHWQKLATFTGGMTGAEGRFSHVDADPGPGKVYYKVCVIDRSGATTLSEVRTLELKSTTRLSIWPVPVQDQLNIANDAAVSAIRVEVFASTGKRMREQALVRGANAIDMSGMGAGVYLLRLTYRDGSSGTRSIMKY